MEFRCAGLLSPGIARPSGQLQAVRCAARSSIVAALIQCLASRLGQSEGGREAHMRRAMREDWKTHTSCPPLGTCVS
eukprot:1093540-Amphidinium_carterae.1